jgi:hypothetical protein
VEVSFVGLPPAKQIERASGVSDVEVDGRVLRCIVWGSFQPFLEALRGHEVIGLRSTAGAAPRRSGGVMTSNILTARIAAALFIFATVAGLLSTAFLNPVLHSSDYLTATFASQDRVIAGAFFSLIAGVAGAGIAIALYPILRRHGEALALGSVGLRLVEGVLYIVGAIAALSLVTLSQEVAKAPTPAPPYFKTTGLLLLALRDHAILAGVLAFYLGATMYYYIFYRSRLIPRWLSGWGIAGTTLGLAAGMLVLFGVTGYMSTLQVVLNLPIGVNEMVLAVWLIVRGFNSSAVAPGSARRSTPAPPAPLST